MNDFIGNAAAALPALYAARAEARSLNQSATIMADSIKDAMLREGENTLAYEGYTASLSHSENPARYDLSSLSGDDLVALAAVPGLIKVDAALLRQLDETPAVYRLRRTRTPSEQWRTTLRVTKD